MATPVWCCGFECAGSFGLGHLAGDNGSASISTTTFKSGLRALRINPTAAAQGISPTVTSSNHFVARVYIRFASLPTATVELFYAIVNGVACGAYFNSSDSKIYAGRATGTLGATGVTVTTGVWYRLDVRVNASANPWTIDVQVNGTACGQVTNGVAANGYTQFTLGNSVTSCSADYFFDDLIISQTTGDYPFGDGYVLSYIPNADGTHNVAGANDFERSGTGTDITNATTDAYQLIDDRPLPSSVADYINGIAPPNSTDYVEWQYEDSVENVAPRAVEGIVVWHSSGTGTNGWTVTLRESAGATSATMGSGTAGNTNLQHARTHHPTVPGTSDAWTKTKFNALRSRFLVSDAAPDPFIDAAMIEAEYPGIATVTTTLQKLTANINTEQSASGFQAEIDPVLRKLTASLNAEQRQLVTVNATLVKTAAALSIVLQPDATITTTLAKVVASLVASHQQRVTVGATLTPVAVSLNVQQEQRLTVASTLRKVTAELNAFNQPDATITTTLRPVQANINASQRYEMTIDTDLAKVTSALNAVLQPDAALGVTLRRVTSNLNAEQRYLMTIATTLRKMTASLNAEQRYLMTLGATLAKVAAEINAQTDAPPGVTIETTLRKVTASLNAQQSQLVTIDTDLRPVSASLNAQQRYLITLASTLAKASANINLSQSQRMTIATVLAHLTSNLNAAQPYTLTVATTLAKLIADLHIVHVTGGALEIDTTLSPVQAALRLMRILSHIDLTGNSSGDIALLGSALADLTLGGTADADIGLSGSSQGAVTLEGNRSAGVALKGNRG